MLGLVLLALSPHFTWTHATLLSQTTGACALLAGLVSWLRWRESRAVGWLALSALALALSFLVRPMPGVFFVASMGLATLLEVRARRASLRDVALFSGVVALGFLGVGLVNLAQSGSMFRSGYHEVYQGLGLFGQERGVTGLSLLGGLWRENFWLFGWPLSLLPLVAARGRRAPWLLWSVVLAELLYRVIVPKTVVSTTGPTYLFEMVPVLCLLVADGLTRVSLVLRRRLQVQRLVTAFVLANVAAALVFFVPVQLRSISDGARLHGVVFRLLEEARIERAVVFTSYLVRLDDARWWSLFAPSPAPALDEDLLFFRWPHDAKDPVGAATRLARQGFPDRPAFVFLPQSQSNPGPSRLELLTPASEAP
jgi:hypothetical protein